MFFDGWRNKWNLLWARLLGRVAVPVDLPALPVAEPDEPVIVARTAKKREPYTHLRDVLEHLPNCRRLIRRLKASDPDAYDYHARVGARIIGNRDRVPPDALLDAFVKSLPSSGMVYMTHDKGGDKIPPSFIYFTKWKPNARVVTPRRFDALYEVTVAYINEQHNTPILAAYHIAVVDGVSVLLKERFSQRYPIPKRKKNGGGVISRIETGYPPMLKMIQADNKGFAPSIEEMGRYLFHFAANFYATSTEGFQVRAERGGISVAFNVELRRTAQFFRSRDITAVASDGKRKRIFHYVSAHTRSNGSEVRAHYKGLRRFKWEGNSVVITPPERSLRLWTAEAFDGQDAQINAEALNAAETATLVRRAIEG